MSKAPHTLVLGLDLATITGWSRFQIRPGGSVHLVDAGIIDCSIRVADTRTIPRDPDGKRFALLWDGLGNLAEYAVPSAVYFEAAVGGPFAGGPAQRVAIGMITLVQQWAYTSGIECHAVAAGTVKKHATGDGTLTKTTKLEMVSAALKTFGNRHLPRRTPTTREPWEYDDNVADAIWVGHYGACLEAGITYAPDRGRK